MISTRKADLAWGRAIHTAGRCAICGAQRNLEAHHIISRSHHSTRNYTENGILLCPACHRGKQSAHNSHRWFMDWLETHRPEQAAWVKENRWKIAK